MQAERGGDSGNPGAPFFINCFLKYNDNKFDSSVIDFYSIKHLKNFLDISYDCMCECYYEGSSSFYLQSLDS